MIAEIEIVARVAETGRLIARETHVLAELEEQFEDARYARGVFKGGFSQKRADAVVAPTGGAEEAAVTCSRSIGSGASITRRRKLSSSDFARVFLAFLSIPSHFLALCARSAAAVASERRRR